MKQYVIIPFLALGILCFPIPIFIIEFNCTGQEIFPTFYGSPFIYKSTSLATSLAYDYYLAGLIESWLMWILTLGLVWYLFDKYLLNKKNKFLKHAYKGIVTLLIIITSISIIFTIQTNAGSNLVWRVDIEKLSKDWGMKCKGEFKLTAS